MTCSRSARLLILFAVLFGIAKKSQAGAGTTAADFLKMGVGARAAAMGEAATTITNDASALYWNPAALTQVENHSLLLMHSDYLESSDLQYGAYAHRFGHQAFGLGLQRLSVGKIPVVDETGIQTSDISPYDQAFSLGYAAALKKIALGASVKFVESRLVSSDNTATADIGILVTSWAKNRLHFGAAATNLGGKLTYDSQAASLPTLLRAGFAYQLKPFSLISLEAGKSRGNSAYMAAGTEFTIKPSDILSMALRAGYNTKLTKDLSGLAGFSCGIGFGFKAFNIDYAFVPMGDLGATHRFSVLWSLPMPSETLKSVETPKVEQNKNHNPEQKISSDNRKEKLPEKKPAKSMGNTTRHQLGN